MRHQLAERLFTRSLDHLEAAVECHDEGEHRQSDRQYRIAVLYKRLSSLVGYDRKVRRNVKRTLDLV